MNNTTSPLASTPSPLVKSILKKRSSPASGASVQFGSAHILDFEKGKSPSEVGAIKRKQDILDFEKGKSPSEVGATKRRDDIYSHSILRQTPLTQTPLSENEQKIHQQLEINRAKVMKATERGEKEATLARANATRTPTIQYRGEAPVVNEQSFATQLTGVPEATGKAFYELAGNVQSLISDSFLGNLLASDKSLQSSSSLPSGPEEVPQRVSRPNGTGNGNIKPHQRQVPGPRPEGHNWEQRVTSSREGGRGGETGGGRGGRG